MTAVEPERCRGVVDGDLPDGNGGGRGVHELEAGVDAGDRASGVGDVGARRGEGGLGDGVVLVEELELDDITIRDTGEPACEKKNCQDARDKGRVKSGGTHWLGV